MEAIDLGIKSPSPEVASPAGKPEDSVHYPSLYIDSDSPLPQLPETGTMTIAFKRGSRSMNESAEGEQRHSVVIEVTQILDVEGGEAEEGDQEANDEDRDAQLDKYAADEVKGKAAGAGSSNDNVND
jgi:hypothetical protein